MKSIMKKWSAAILMVLAIMFNFSLTIVYADLEENFPTKYAIVLDSNMGNKHSITILNFPSNGKVKNLKSSNTKIVKVSLDKDSNNIKRCVLVTAKKAGTAKISFDIVDKKTGKKIQHDTCKVQVKKHTNPFSSVKLNGKNITSQFNKTSYPWMSVSAQKTSVTIKMKKGYKLLSIQRRFLNLMKDVAFDAYDFYSIEAR